MFDNRFHCLLKVVILPPAHPIGKVVDYFYRVEFQQRGSPHTHCLFWVENPAKFGWNTDDEIIGFIDNYVTCSLPPETDDMYEVVFSVQQHSKKLSISCKKKGTTCRFNFPRPPTNESFLTHTKTEQEQNETDENRNALAKQILTKVKECSSQTDSAFDSIDDLYSSLGVNQEIF